MTNKPSNWKTVSSKMILNHHLLKVTEDVAKLPDGKETTYVRHAPSKNDSVIIIALDNNGDVLVQREYSYPPNKVMFQLPGGSMKPGESIITAAKRELAEESGYSGHSIKQLGSYYVINRLSDKQQHVLLFKNLFRHKLKEDDDEFIETLWLPKDKIIQMIRNQQIDNINLLAALNMWFCNESINE